MSPRANPLPPEQRRANLIAATLPLLQEQGFNVSTAQIAEAAGVAEGTIFRVFDSKQDLLAATVASVMDAGPVVAAVDAIDLSLPLDARLARLVALLCERTAEVSKLMFALHSTGPSTPHEKPDHNHHDEHHGEAHQRQSALINAATTRLLTPDADRFALPLPQVASLLRSLAVLSAHPLLSDGALSDPDQIVQVFLHGVLKEPSC